MTTPDPQAAQRLFVLNDIGERERAALEAVGKNPDDCCTLLTPAVQMEMAVQPGPNGAPVLLLNVIVAVPADILPMPTRGILDAAGNTSVSAKAREAIPVAPYLHLVVARSALGEAVRADLDRSRVLRTLAGGAP